MSKITATEFAKMHDLTVDVVTMRCDRGSYKSADHSTGIWMIDKDDVFVDRRKSSTFTAQQLSAFGYLYHALREKLKLCSEVPATDITTPYIAISKLITMYHQSCKIDGELEQLIADTLDLVDINDVSSGVRDAQKQGGWWLGYYKFRT